MKLELTEEIKLTRTEIVAPRENQKQQQVANLRHIPGLKIWALNMETGDVAEAPMISMVHYKKVGDKSEPYTRHRVDVQPGHLYYQALNQENAARKFCKMLGIKHPKYQ